MAKPRVSAWSETVRLSEVGRGAVRRSLSPEASQLPAIARVIGVDALRRLVADVDVSPWLDGAEVRGRFAADVTQTCGVTLEPLEQSLEGDFLIRVLPADSPNLPSDDAEIDLEADDPPDVLEGEDIDLAAYVVEHLALEVDPFPRKEGVVFEPPESESEASPFAALKDLKLGDPS